MIFCLTTHIVTCLITCEQQQRSILLKREPAGHLAGMEQAVLAGAAVAAIYLPGGDVHPVDALAAFIPQRVLPARAVVVGDRFKFVSAFGHDLICGSPPKELVERT